MKLRIGCVVVGFLSLVLSLAAQTSVSGSSTSQLPRFVKFSGTLKQVNGSPLSGIAGVTFALYSEQTGGAPLWLETQNVQADNSGHYTVMLGATKSEGVPVDLFASEQAQWLGVQPQGQAEQPRVMLLSVPYALKAVDAETLGGKPASAYALATTPTTTSPAAIEGATAHAALGVSSTQSSAHSATTGTGTTNYIPRWTSSTALGNSLIFQSGTTEIGINTTTPGATLGVKGNGIFTASSSTEALEVTQAGGTGSGILGTTNSTNGFGVVGKSTSTTDSGLGGVGVYGFSANPIGIGIEGENANIGIYGNNGSAIGKTGVGVQGGGNQYGVYGFTNASVVATTQAGVYGTTNNDISAAYGVQGVATTAVGAASGVYGSSTGPTGYGVQGIASSSTGTAVGVYGSSTAPSGFGVEGVSPNVGLRGQGAYGVDAHGTLAAVKGEATASGALSGFFTGGAVEVVGNANNTWVGDPGCGAGYAGLGFLVTGGLSGCTNYALMGDPNGGTYINSHASGGIAFRNNNAKLATIDDKGNLDVIGQNGGGNLTVTGKVSSSNVIAQVSASNTVVASSISACKPTTLTSPNANCVVPNMSLTKTTGNPNVLIMANIGGITTDPCVVENFYLIVDTTIVALSSVSGNDNNTSSGHQISSTTLMSLQNLAPGSHTFEVQATDDNSSGSCGTFVLSSYVSQGDGGRGSQRSLIVREF
jgi:hypothetical protein